jgi:hypothetical protein
MDFIVYSFIGVCFYIKMVAGELLEQDKCGILICASCKVIQLILLVSSFGNIVYLPCRFNLTDAMKRRIK